MNELVAQRLDRIDARIRERTDRRVTVIAVTKAFGVEALRAAVAAGCRDIGENYAQELVDKMREYGDHDRPTVHFIGRLQSNKVKMLAPVVDVWQSVDRASLVDEIARRAPGARIFVQVNATGEADKGGCDPGLVPELVETARARGLRVEGLMVVGPTDGDPQRTATAFTKVAALAREVGVSELSMGMSDDLDLALDAGSTMVRIGSAIFGGRPPTR
ncbi:MAG: YggS family pyridoxal phosphate-dependent enzyme [Ilumatobacteraceae bacterium]|jgi:pyridoxal phosphate enzyme (YggS family)